MNKSKILFLMILMMGTIMTVSSNNWISMWMGLEINMMSFIPLMMTKNKSSAEAAMTYFLIQSMSSMILMMMVTINMYSTIISNNMINNLMMISLLIKMGAAPFHMWFPMIMSKMSWNNCLILMTWQKIAPLTMISNIMCNDLIYLSIILSAIIGGIGGLNQTSLRKIMGYSSISHLGWMLTMNQSINLWMTYLMIYSMMTWTLLTAFSQYKLFFINQLSILNLTNQEKISLSISMLSMGGLPPFIGFLPKWIAIQSMINRNMYVMIFILIMMSLITLMYYLRMMINMFLMSNMSIKWSYNQLNKQYTMMMMMLNLSLPIIIMLDMI
nr:NADH dehydrogenase subunit 2 [Aeschrocoris ceylonicus]